MRWLVFLIAIAAWGQTELHIEVRDPSSAGMKASGKLGDRKFDTDSRGTYTFSNLSFGSYRLEVAKAGFVTKIETIDLQSATAVTRVVTLELAQETARVEVVATTPLQGVDLPIEQIPAPVQLVTDADIAHSGAVDLSDFLNRRLNGVHVNEMQGNPFQPDVNYRGYTASPLLGTPQGVSVYMDGVRQNQPFGDVVSWDLIPKNAISEITLMPGSNPVFGLNTLGGALSIATKDGVRNPGLGGGITYGSSGRKALDAAWGGGKATGFNWFFAANAFHESGWRFDSPSDVRQGFMKLGWRNVATDLAFTGSYAYNTLTGNGLQDYRLLAQSYSSVYTVPDTTSNRSPALNFQARHTISSSWTFSGNVWYRDIRTEGINGNANTDSFDQPQPTAAGCIASAILPNEPSQNCNAITIFTKEVQHEYGLSSQITSNTSPSFGHNQFTIGAGFDRGIVDFTQTSQFGYLNPNRSITGVPAFTDSPVDLHGTTPNWSVFATDTVSLGNQWHFTVSGRYNRSWIDNRDRLNPTPNGAGGPGSLDAKDVYGRFNPSAGLTYSPNAMLNLYANYSQGSRAPTSIELGCADPADPCSLPNALASDPPLNQVVTSTWEAGVRGKFERNAFGQTNWNFDAFRAENTNDILFVSAPQLGTGYFKNFAKTRREGFQASVDSRFKRVTGGIDYTFLAATYQSVETVNGTSNSTSDAALAGLPGTDGVITIHPGNRIPLIPKQTGKIFADFQATPKLMFDAGLVATSSAYARGNENNAYRTDEKYYLGPGYSAGYAVVNLSARYNLSRRLQVGVEVDNLLDKHYATAAQLGVTGLTPQGTFLARPFPALPSGDFPLQSVTFVAPGAPRRIWIDLRLRF